MAFSAAKTPTKSVVKGVPINQTLNNIEVYLKSLTQATEDMKPRSIWYEIGTAVVVSIATGFILYHLTPRSKSKRKGKQVDESLSA